jgi:hypothetical protein
MDKYSPLQDFFKDDNFSCFNCASCNNNCGFLFISQWQRVIGLRSMACHHMQVSDIYIYIKRERERERCTLNLLSAWSDFVSDKWIALMYIFSLSCSTQVLRP